jgi:acetyl-CoA carboxylase biotin carboxyl carrier protein
MDGIEEIRHVLELARKDGITEVEAASADWEFAAKLDPRASAPMHAAVTVQEIIGEEPLAEKLVEITAPCVGYFQAAANAISEGDKIESGQVVASIRALNLGNDVESRVSGTVVELLTKPDQAVQFGQPLMRVRADA